MLVKGVLDGEQDVEDDADHIHTDPAMEESLAGIGQPSGGGRMGKSAVSPERISRPARIRVSRCSVCSTP